MEDYRSFLKKKKFTVTSSGFTSAEVNPNLFGWQTDIVHWALRKGKAAIFSECGSGKGQPYGSNVLSENGWTEIQKLSIGDKVYGSDGKLHQVLGVYPKNELDTYRFYYSDGTSVVFDKDHLHIVRTNNDRQRTKRWRVMSTTEILGSGNIRYGVSGKSRNYDVPLTMPIEKTGKEYYIHPYIMGVLIGNGYIEKNVQISSADVEIVQKVRELLPIGVELEHRQKYDYSIMTKLTGSRRYPFRAALVGMGMWGKKSYDKKIPQEYMDGSIEQRKSLLNGLMDTDGCFCDGAQYDTTSKELANNVRELVWSLGGIATISQKNAGYKGKDGEFIQCKDCYTVFISFKDFNPFSLERKAKKWKKHPRDNGRWIDRIEYEKKQPTVCISVDSPDQSYITENYLVTHNTRMLLQWSKEVSEKTQKPVIVFVPLAVAQQTKREGIACGIPVTVCRKQRDVQTGVNVVNYEMMEHFDAELFGGVVLDESSILKHSDSKTRNYVQEKFEQTQYKLCCTATPAPNDFMELGTHAQFLGVMKQTEMLATFFVHDGGDTSHWRLKKHAESSFFEWVAGWACCMRRPQDLGYEQDGYDLPELRIHEVIVASEVMETEDGQQMLIAPTGQTLNERRQARRCSMADRVAKAAEIANATDEQVMIWCDLNAESEGLAKSIDGAVEVTGSMPNEKKEERIVGFLDGENRVLVSKPSIAGWGLNAQNCRVEIFVGLSDSFESYYQAVRRCWRYGQTKPVDVYIVVSEAEGAVKANIERKQRDATRMTDELIGYTKEFLKNDLHATGNQTIAYFAFEDMEVPEWLITQKE